MSEGKKGTKGKASSSATPPQIIVNGNLEGWLHKRGGKSIIMDLTWQRRYFCQNGDKLIYSKEKSAKQKGFINLFEVTSVDSLQEPKFGLRLVTPNRTYVMHAESNAERVVWLEALRERCPRVKLRMTLDDPSPPVSPRTDAVGATGTTQQGASRTRFPSTPTSPVSNYNHEVTPIAVEPIRVSPQGRSSAPAAPSTAPATAPISILEDQLQQPQQQQQSGVNPNQHQIFREPAPPLAMIGSTNSRPSLPKFVQPQPVTVQLNQPEYVQIEQLEILEP